jgi:methionyl-tRNA formyltransferase
MAAPKAKILFFGNERLATGLSTDAPVLRALIAKGYDITGVVVAQKAASASRKARNLEIVDVAESHGIVVVSPEKLSEAKDDIAAFKADIGVLIAYGKIVPQNIIDVFEHGIINIHPSLLPLHRGPTPLESVILNGETTTGVSLMSLHKDMDAGPVYAQQEVTLTGKETKAELAEKLIEVGKNMLIEKLPEILDGSLQPKNQDGTKATYDKLIEKTACVLDFNKPAKQLEREVRAYNGWPRSRCNIGMNEVIISQAHAEEADGVMGTLWLKEKQLGIHCSEGVLIFDKVIPVGKKEMDASDYLLGQHLPS